MTLAILLSLEDIQTHYLDGQFQITTTEGMLVRFTEEAAEEFIKSVHFIREAIKEKRDK